MRLSRDSSWVRAVAAGLLLSACVRAPDRRVESSLDVKEKPLPVFEYQGKPFCFAGTNNYYVIFKPRPMVDAVLESAAAMKLKVMRLWAFLDRGSLDGSVPDLKGEPGKDGVYFQYWDPKARAPAFNDGPNGLERLDYVVYKAEKLGLKLIMVLTNNWQDFGGMDQYLLWYGLDRHDLFYTDPRVKAAYKGWILHLLHRRNTLTGRLYKEEPAIFSWELANEPRAISGKGFDRRDGWTTSTLTDWVTEMSAYIKSLDPNHLVSVGDEGFLNSDGDHWTYRATDGVDHVAMTSAPGIDFGTFHMYPEDWGTVEGWAEEWIRDHVKVARELGKPTVLEEYGWKVKRDEHQRATRGREERELRYGRWNETLLRGGGAGSMFWMLADEDETGALYPDYDHFTLYRGIDSAPMMAELAERFDAEAPGCKAAEPYAGRRAPSEFVRTLVPGESELLASLGGS
jgi:mannan endo-1,4-beta-mannosidase